MKIALFASGLLLLAALTACQTTKQETSRDHLINDALLKASIPASRGALVAVAAQSTGRILSKPLYRGVTGSRRVADLLSRDWVGEPISAFEKEARRLFSGPVQEFQHPQEDRSVLVFSN